MDPGRSPEGGCPKSHAWSGGLLNNILYGFYMDDLETNDYLEAHGI